MRDTLQRGHKACSKEKITGWELSALSTPSPPPVYKKRPNTKWKTTKMSIILDLGGSNDCLGNLWLSVSRVWISPNVEIIGVKYLLQMFVTKEDRKWTEVRK